MRRLREDRTVADRTGFTLPEVVLGLAITTVLLGAMGSLVMISSRSIPGATTPNGQAISTARALEQVTADLALATTIVAASDKSIEFTVPDRNGDGQPEDIKYSWTGLSTDPLIRVVNGGTQGVALNQVSQFSLSYTTATTSSSTASALAAQPESVLETWSAGLLGGLLYTGYSLGNSKQLAQNFRPVLPAGTKSWTVTRVQIYGSSDLIGTGRISVQLRTTDSSGLPTSTVLASTTMNESAFPVLVYGMAEADFTNVPALSPNQEVTIVVSCSSSCPAGSLGYTTLSIGRTTPMATSSSGTWSSSTLNVMPYVIYGTTTTVSPQTVNDKRLYQIGVKLQAGSSSSPQLSATVNVLNTPEAQ